MKVSWAEGSDPQQIISRIEQGRSSEQEGKVSFEAFAFKECSVLLYDLLVFSDPVPEIEGRLIVSQAIMNVGKKGPITSSSLLAEVNKLTDAYLHSPLEHFVLATSLSLYQYTELKPLRVNGAIVKFEHQLPNRFTEERTKITPRDTQVLFADLPTDYLSVRVSVSARSIHEAADAGLGALDLIRAIWNWFYNRQHLTRISLGSQSPVNEIAIGPIHTLHKPSGELATETFWYEPSYRAPIQPKDLKHDIANVQRFYRSVRAKLRKSKYRVDLERALVRYVRALDERDWHIAFLKLWSVLEFLTSTTAKDSHEVTIRRVAYVFAQREYQLQVLKALRDHRNQVVHASASTEEIQTYMYLLKRCIETLFGFHLANNFGFSSLKDAAVFLDLPTDLDALNSRIRLARYALRFRGLKHT
jgi:Apea-like HEPN